MIDEDDSTDVRWVRDNRSNRVSKITYKNGRIASIKRGGKEYILGAGRTPKHNSRKFNDEIEEESRKEKGSTKEISW